MKGSFVLVIASCIFTGTAFHNPPGSVHSLDARHLLLRRADSPFSRLRISNTRSSSSSGSPPRSPSPMSDASGDVGGLKKAEREAAAARRAHYDEREIMQDMDESNAWTQSSRYGSPGMKHRKSKSVIDQGQKVVSKQRQRGYAYSAAAKVAGTTNNAERELRNARKAESAFASSEAVSKEMQYASTKAKHAMHPEVYSEPQHKKQLLDEKKAYVDANRYATYVRGNGGRDSGSESDLESHGRPISTLAASVHGLGRDPKLYKHIKAQQERNR